MPLKVEVTGALVGGADWCLGRWTVEVETVYLTRE